MYESTEDTASTSAHISGNGLGRSFRIASLPTLYKPHSAVTFELPQPEEYDAGNNFNLILSALDLDSFKMR